MKQECEPVDPDILQNSFTKSLTVWILLYIVWHRLGMITVTSVEKPNSKFVSVCYELISAKLILKLFGGGDIA